MTNFNVSKISIDKGSSCDIMYAKLFEKIELKRKKLWPYEGVDLQALSNTITRPWGYIELMVTLGKERDTNMIDLQFLVVPYKRV